MDLFSKTYNHIFHPFGLESLYHLSTFIKEKNKVKDVEKIKLLTLQSVSFLIEKDIISILEYDCTHSKSLKKIESNHKKTIEIIKNKLNDIEKLDELYDFFWFKFKDWYVKGLENLGVSMYTLDWPTFVEEKIGDLEQWIEENKPLNY